MESPERPDPGRADAAHGQPGASRHLVVAAGRLVEEFVDEEPLPARQLGGGAPDRGPGLGEDDDVEEMVKYLTAVSKEPEPDKIRAYAEGSVEHFDWLESLGFEFERSYYPEKAVIQPGTQGLMYTGSEKAWPFCEQAVPAPRGHKVPVPGDTGGAAMVVGLAVQRLGELGVEVRYDTGATALVVDGGRVVASDSPAAVLTEPLIESVYAARVRVLAGDDGHPVVAPVRRQGGQTGTAAGMPD